MAFGGAIKLNKRGYSVLACLVMLLLYFHFHKESLSINDQVSLSDLLQTAVKAAEAGGKLVVSVKNDLKIQSKGKTKEGMDDSVTTADFLSHCAMKRIITGRFPFVKFISEETNVPCDTKTDKEQEESGEANFKQLSNIRVKSDDVTIWIDPLDATHEYTEKLYQYVTTMVCVAVKGEPTIGVIHNPFTGSTSWAVVGYLHSHDLASKKITADLSKVKVIISRSHSGTIKEVLGKNLENVEIVVAAGAGYKVLQVADGAVNAYLHITAIKKWDICAGHAILNALGGKMTTKHGKSLTYQNDTDVVNQEGLIATLTNHDFFVDKF